MSITQPAAEKLVDAGANLVIESGCPEPTLEKLVAIARRSGAQITVKGEYPFETMEKVAAVGKNHVTFVI